MATQSNRSPDSTTFWKPGTRRVEGVLVLATSMAFVGLIVLSAVSVSAHFSTTVGATRVTKQFHSASHVSLGWSTVSGAPTTLRVTNIFQNVTLEDGVASPTNVVYEATATSGTIDFVANDGTYVFTDLGPTVGTAPVTVIVSGTVSTPVL